MEHVQQGGHARIVLGVPDRLPTRRAGEDGFVERRGRGRILGAEGLPAEPFLDAAAAVGMQAVEESEGLVEEIGADLARGKKFHINFPV